MCDILLANFGRRFQCVHIFKIGTFHKIYAMCVCEAKFEICLMLPIFTILTAFTPSYVWSMCNSTHFTINKVLYLYFLNNTRFHILYMWSFNSTLSVTATQKNTVVCITLPEHRKINPSVPKCIVHYSRVNKQLHRLGCDTKYNTYTRYAFLPSALKGLYDENILMLTLFVTTFIKHRRACKWMQININIW